MIIIINSFKFKMAEIKKYLSHTFGALFGGIKFDTISEEDQKWLNYNYPPCLNLVYYSCEGLKPRFLRIVKPLNYNVWLVLGIQLINVVNCISQVCYKA